MTSNDAQCYHSYGAPDTNAPIALANAASANITRRDVYMVWIGPRSIHDALSSCCTLSALHSVNADGALFSQALRQNGEEYMGAGSIVPSPLCDVVRNACIHLAASQFPCPLCGTSGASQVQDAVSALQDANANFTMFWFDIEGGSQYWSTDISFNQQFFEDMMNEAAKLQIQTGVYTNLNEW